jgi:DNA-binding response OmpR family regulator
MYILIVEDEKQLAEEIKTFLGKENFICDIAYCGRDASEKIFVNDYDFVLLDLGLPDYDGLTLLKEAKEANKECAFIILTARGAVDDKVKGLNLGADDYLAKPFSLLELLSRIHAIVRRKHGLKKNTIEVHGFTLDIQNRTVYYRKKPIALTRKEFDVLSYLVLHKNKLLTRVQITEHIWGDVLEENYDSNFVDVHIKNIRKKLSVFASVDWLETVRGIGYRVNS